MYCFGDFVVVVVVVAFGPKQRHVHAGLDHCLSAVSSTTGLTPSCPVHL